jgi:hypothetical protein
VGVSGAAFSFYNHSESHHRQLFPYTCNLTYPSRISRCPPIALPSPHTGAMTRDLEMTDAAPVAWDGELCSPSVMQKWTPQELCDYHPVKDILRDEGVRTAFRNAEIDGNAFLLAVDDPCHWKNWLKLPLGPTIELEHLTEMIKYVDEVKSQGISSILALTNRLTLLPLPPGNWNWSVQMLTFLHGLLWQKGASLGDKVFRQFQYPSWDRDRNPHTGGDTWTALKLSLSDFLLSGAELENGRCLPCSKDTLLVRNAYPEMYGVLVEAQERRLECIKESKPLSDTQKIILILGQPGIGKTWFLSYVLVRRLLEGQPTIFQVADNFRGDSGCIDGTHYLIDGNGVRQMGKRPPLYELKNPAIWVLADQMPVGAPRRVNEHRWLVVVTSSPRESNNAQLLKHHSPQQYYLPTWDWKEIVAAA